MESVFELNPTGFILFSDKLIHILPLGILFALVIKQLFDKKDKKINLFFTLIVVSFEKQYPKREEFFRCMNVLRNRGRYDKRQRIASLKTNFTMILNKEKIILF